MSGTPVWMRMRRSSGAVAAVALGALAVGLSQVRADAWQGRWVDTQLAVNVATGAVLLPLVVALGAWTAGEPRRVGMHAVEASMPRGPVARLRSTWLVVSARAVAAWLLLFVPMTVSTAAENGEGRIPLALVAVNVALVIGGAGLGVAAGTAFPARLTAPISAALAYAVVVSLSYNGRPWQRLVPVFTERWDPQFREPVLMLLLAAAFVLSLAASAVIAAAVGRPRRAGDLAVVVAGPVAALALAGMLVTLKTDVPVPRQPLASDRACGTSDAGRVCLWRTESYLLPRAVAAHEQAALAAGALPSFPRDIAQVGLERGTLPIDDAQPDATDLVQAVLRATVGPSDADCPPRTVAAGTGEYPLELLVADLLNGRIGLRSTPLDEQYSTALAALRALANPAQDEWLRSAVAALRDCSAKPPALRLAGR